jgi:hypothetical protein
MSRWRQPKKEHPFAPVPVPHISSYADLHEELLDIVDALARDSMALEDVRWWAERVVADHDGAFYGGHRTQKRGTATSEDAGPF